MTVTLDDVFDPWILLKHVKYVYLYIYKELTVNVLLLTLLTSVSSTSSL